MTTLFFAYLAGILTLLNPCILPLLPITLAGAIQSGKTAPLYLAAGLACSFTFIGFGITAFGPLIGLDIDVINEIAAYLMILFGIILLVPNAQSIVSKVTRPLVRSANSSLDKLEPNQQKRPHEQFIVGILLGAVWSPCIGPTLGGAIGLAAQGTNLLFSFVTMVIFSLGVCTIVLALSYGSRELIASRQGKLMKIMPLARPIMGVALILVGIALALKWHHIIERFLVENLPYWFQDISIIF